ncbi:MAG: hypothetical protein D6801_06625 [Alphaproteobacteria bacterium]|nr:MAG: hypothetical protein D6801_06625 [Alphaproteobacteria bacterium]
MRFMKPLALAAMLAMPMGAAVAGSYSSDAPVVVGKLGDQVYLMTSDKMTLYTFDKDGKGVSNCYGDCAVKWPPLDGSGVTDLPPGYSVIDRKDGTKQIAYKGHPLYLWFKDTKPGDMTGDGVKGVWHVARP